jgi:hypothetical protein
MTKKLIYLNAGLLVLFFAPTVLYRFNSHYECTAGMFGTYNKVTWKASAEKYKKAASLSISACKGSSERPDKCDVLSCKNYFF